MTTKWGEDKVYFEEAIAGALMAGACGAALVAPFVNAITFQNIVAGSFGLTEIITLSTIGVSMAAGFTLLGWQKAEWIYEGMEYISDPLKGMLELQRKENVLMSPEQKKGEVTGWTIGGAQLSRKREVAHIRINGLPGSGKTVLIKNIIWESLTRSTTEKLVIHDPKGDFTSWLYDKNDTILMGPWDKRFSAWDISKDINAPADATAAARKIATDGVDSSSTSGSSKFFTDAVTYIFAGYMMYNMRKLGDNWSWDTIAADFMSGVMIDKARLGDPSLNILIPLGGKGEQMQNVLSSLGSAIGWIPSYAASLNLVNNPDGTLNREKSGLFSIKQWLNGTENQHVRKIIFNNNKNYEKLAQQIFGLMYSTMESFINSAEMPTLHEDAPNALSVITDEMPQLGVEIGKALANMEEMGRSKGVRVIKAIQDESQITALLGKEKGRASNSVQQTRIYLMTANETAAEVARGFGHNTQIRVETPVMAGSGNKRIIKDDKHEVIKMTDFTGLKVLPGVGVEMIVNTADSLVKVIQPFLNKEFSKNKIDPETGNEVEQIVQNDRFMNGILHMAADIEAANEYEYLKSIGENPTPPVPSGNAGRAMAQVIIPSSDFAEQSEAQNMQYDESDLIIMEAVDNSDNVELNTEIGPNEFNPTLFDSFLLPSVESNRQANTEENQDIASFDFNDLEALSESDMLAVLSTADQFESASINL